MSVSFERGGKRQCEWLTRFSLWIIVHAIRRLCFGNLCLGRVRRADR